MTPYLVFLFAPIVVKILIESRAGKCIDADERLKKIFCITVGIIIFTMFALKSKHVGSADSSHYYANWERLGRLNFSGIMTYAASTTMEKGYLFSTWALAHIFHSGQYTFVFSGLIYSASVMSFVYRYSDDSVISTEMFIGLGLYEFMMQGMRQSIAMSICLFGIEFCKERKLIHFILIVALASLFHQTAIVFLLVYFFYGQVLNAKTGLLSFIAAIILISLSGVLVSAGNDLFEREYTMTVSSGGFVATAIYLIIVIIGAIAASRKTPIYGIEHYRNAQNDLSFYWFMCFFGCSVYIMRYFAAHAAQRISFYYMYSQMILLPNSLFVFDSRSQRFIKPIIVAACIALLLYRFPREGMIPYSFFWQ